MVVEFVVTLPLEAKLGESHVPVEHAYLLNTDPAPIVREVVVALPLIVVEAKDTAAPDCVIASWKTAGPASVEFPEIVLDPIITAVAEAVPKLNVPDESTRDEASPEISVPLNVSAANATDVPNTANTNQNEPTADAMSRVQRFPVLSI